MSHRVEDKQARREARLRAEETARLAESRQRLMRRTGFAAVGVIAATLVTLAVVLPGNGAAPPADHMGADGGNAATANTRAPDFSLTDVVSGRRVTAASLRGRKTMLFFSEGVSCQACLVQIADLQKAGALKRAEIGLVSVTTDQPGDLAAAARQYGIRTPLLADPTTRMSAAYGMLGHGGMGHPGQGGHAFMLVGADGRILWHRAYQAMYVKPSELLHDMSAEATA